MDQKVLRPLYLIPQYNVTVIEDNQRIQNPAQVEYNRLTDSYEISFNQTIIKKMYETSALRNYITIEDMQAGLSFHEVFHIEYKSFSIPYVIDNPFFHFCHNVLCDNQIEWHGSRDHPEAAKYLRYMLTALRKDTDFSSLRKSVANLTKAANIDKLEKLKDTFFYLTRFGVIIQDSDQEFVKFLLPLILSAMRNEPQNLMDATQAVYEYFHFYAKQYDIDLSNIGVKTRSITAKEMKIIDGIIGAGEQVISSSIQKTIEMLKQQIPNSKNMQAGQMAGLDGPKVQVIEKDTHFYRQTVRKYETKIRQIRNAFKRRLDQVQAIPAFDGELNWAKQQQAYIDSFNLEEGKNYNVFKRNRISMHTLVCRDISSSTSQWKVEYAELTVCLHAALQNLPGIIDGHIDFNYYAQLLMDFGDPIREAAIYPNAVGGTQFNAAFEIALKMKWSGTKKNIINVITDGDSGSGYEESEAALENRGIKIWYWDVSPYDYKRTNPRIRKTSFDKFHIDIANALLKEL